tara:strand:- start:1176 stop:1868 length:693 start_codon:yes stop_codon:yes gene_type:complete
MIEEDWEAWGAFPQHRWLFNKLELSSKLKYDCGPACFPISNANTYIIRPIYNLYGMGIGAHKKFLDPKIHGEEMKYHKHIPPGYFWCEYFEGTHYSLDFIREGNRWTPFSSMIGRQDTEQSLSRFVEWEVITPSFFTVDLPKWIENIQTEKYLNIETKGKKILEIHLRSGNDVAWNFKPGTKIIPVWKGVDYKEYKHLPFIENFHKESFIYEADGNLSDIRLGYYVNEKI